jgi:hypothetical protein
VHTSETLRGTDFAFAVDGHPATIEDVLPGLGRLGVVVNTHGGAAGASTLILAAVTAFYDRLREAGEPFFAYPDFFAFHVNEGHGTLRKLDVFPAHKEIVVTGGPEELLRAINDRAVTHLLVPDAKPARELTVSAEALHSARRRIRTALAYHPGGRTDGGDVTITGPAAGQAFVAAMTGGAPRSVVGTATRPVETFRRLELDPALRMLETVAG